MKIYDYIFWFGMLAYIADQVYFQKRRDKKWYAKQRKELVDGIIADLKASDTVLVINETDKSINKVLMQKTPDVMQ